MYNIWTLFWTINWGKILNNYLWERGRKSQTYSLERSIQRAATASPPSIFIIDSEEAGSKLGKFTDLAATSLFLLRCRGPKLLLMNWGNLSIAVIGTWGWTRSRVSPAAANCLSESESLWDLALILESRSCARAPGFKYLWFGEASVLFVKAFIAVVRERGVEGEEEERDCEGL